MRNETVESPHKPTSDELTDLFRPNQNNLGAPALDKAVYHPDHYTAGGIEVIDFIDAKLNAMTHLKPAQAYYLGCALKYIPRAGVKDPTTFKQDIEKAIFYLRKAIGEDPR